MFIRLLMLLFLLIAPLFSKVLLQDDKTIYDDFTIEYFYDKTSQATITDIVQKDFTQSSSNSFTFGYISDVIWFKIDVENLSEKDEFVLSFKEVLWSSFDLYYQKNGVWIKKVNGLNVPLLNREVKDVYPAFNFSLQPHEKTTLYIRGQTISGELGKFEIFEHNTYYNPTRMGLLNIYIAFSFILIGILVINIHNFFLTRELTYFYYILYIFMSILFGSMHSGSYLILGLHGWNEGLHVVGVLLVVFLLLFTDRFLNFRNESPLLHSFMMSSVYILFFLSLLIFNDVPYSCMIFNFYSIVIFTLVFFGVIKALLLGSVEARFYLFALIIYMFFMGLMIMTFNTLLPYMDVSRHLFVMGAFIEVSMFTFILTNKYRSDALEKLRIQEELVFEKSKNESYLQSEIEKRTRELQMLASTDSMTKLYNRRYFKEISMSMLDLAKRNNSSLAVIMIDIDDFKSINDNYGHAIGDEVIISVAESLREFSRKSDIVSRWGGEEFLILLPQTNLTGGLLIAEKILKHIETNALELGDNTKLHYTVSIGVSVVDVTSEESLEPSINRADKALYEAKEYGKNRVVSSV